MHSNEKEQYTKTRLNNSSSDERQRPPVGKSANQKPVIPNEVRDLLLLVSCSALIER
jgi:hypothetical protein